MSDILLVHGSCHGAWCWRDLAPELAALGHSVSALDLPGMGADRTPLSKVTLDSYAKAIVDALSAPTVLIGHSAGGYAITAAASLAPEKVAHLSPSTSRVASLFAAAVFRFLHDQIAHYW